MTARRTRGKWTDPQALDELERLLEPKNFHAERFAYEEQWLKGASYFAGQQSFMMDGLRMRRPTNIPEHRVFYEASLMTGAIVKAKAAVKAQRARMAVAPRTAHRHDRWAAKISMRVLDHVQRVVSYDEMESLALLWAANMGSAYLTFRWDPTAGEPDRYYLDPDDHKRVIMPANPDQEAGLERDGHYKDLPAGEIVCDMASPFTHYWDWNNKTPFIEKNRFVASVAHVSIDDLIEAFGDVARHVKPDESRLGSVWYEEALTFLASSMHSIGLQSHPHKMRNDRARTITYYEKPNSDLPKGRWVVVAGDTVLRNDDNPHTAAGFWCPTVKLDWVRMMGRYPALSLNEFLTKPQREFNRARSTLIEHQNTYGHPPLLVPDGCGIPTGNFVIDPGAVYSYNHMVGPPIQLQVAPLSQEVVQNASYCKDEIHEISSTADPDMSSIPGQVRGSGGIQMMVEEKHRGLTEPMENLLYSRMAAGKKMLQLGKLYYTGTRILYYIGKDNQLSPMYFTGANIHSDLRIIEAPSSPMTDSAREAKIFQAIELGVLDMQDPKLRRVIQEALHFNMPLEEVYEADELDENNQWKEIERMISQPGYVPLVKPYEDHEAHADVTERFMKSDEYEGLEQSSPAAHQSIYQHWTKHMDEIRAQYQGAQEIMQTMKGAPGDKGQASQPRSQMQAI